VVVCSLAELPDPGAKGFTVGTGDWPLRGFVVRRGAQAFAYVNRCPHARFPLNWQPDQFFAPDSEYLMCRMHGALFQVEDGLCVAGPCLGQALRSLPIEIRDGLVVLGDDPDELVRRLA
jgi:nitrite reductase/ring-hydroxylating ferredoxin subunit